MSNELKAQAPGQTTPVAVPRVASIGGSAAVALPPKKPNKHDELRLLVNSRNPIITVETQEEERVEQLLADLAYELSIPMFTWSVTTGLAKFHSAPL